MSRSLRSGSGLIPTDLSGTPLGGGRGLLLVLLLRQRRPDDRLLVDRRHDLFSPAPATVTEVVDFSETMNTSYIDVSLFGNYRGGLLLAVVGGLASRSERPQLRARAHLLEPARRHLLADLYAYGFYDLVGNPLQDTYTANFAVAFGTGDVPDAHTRQAAGQPDLPG